jgi:hypothetical protein
MADPTANAIVFFLKFTPRSPATDIFGFLSWPKAVWRQRTESNPKKKLNK